MKTQNPNVHQYLKNILKFTFKEVMTTENIHYIDFISFKVKCPNAYTHEHFRTVLK